MDGSIDDLNKITEKNGGTLDDTIASLYNKYGVA